MTPSAAFWDKIAEKYAKQPIRDTESYAYTLERTRSYLSASDRVLELGCGTGSTALLLAEGVGHITASDISPAMIDIAKRKTAEQGTSNAEFVVAEPDDPALGGGPYDAVLALNLLHLMPDVPAALRQIHGLLKPGGVFISKTACLKGARLSLKYSLMRAAIPLMQWLGKAPYVNFLSVPQLDRMIADAGFKIIETGNHPVSPPARYVVARKV